MGNCSDVLEYVLVIDTTLLPFRQALDREWCGIYIHTMERETETERSRCE